MVPDGPYQRMKMLQWGRNQSVAETDTGKGIVGADRTASMGPRPIGRGNIKRAPMSRPTENASMGPRPIGRGNLRSKTRLENRHVGFNGAATNRSRKLCHPNPFNVKEQHNRLRAATQVSHSIEHHSFRTVGKLLQMRAFQSASGAA